PPFRKERRVRARRRALRALRFGRALLHRLPVGTGQTARPLLWLAPHRRLRRQLGDGDYLHRPLRREAQVERRHTRQPVAPPLLAAADQHAVAPQLLAQPAASQRQLLRYQLPQYLRGNFIAEQERRLLERIRLMGLTVDTEQVQVL